MIAMIAKTYSRHRDRPKQHECAAFVHFYLQLTLGEHVSTEWCRSWRWTCLQMMQWLLLCSQKMKHDVVHTQVSFLVVKYGNNSTLFHLEAAAVDGLLPAYHSFVLCVIAWCRALPIDRTSTIRMFTCPLRLHVNNKTVNTALIWVAEKGFYCLEEHCS